MVTTEDSRVAAHSVQPCNLSQAELEHPHGQAGRCCRHGAALVAVDGLKDPMEGVRHCQKLNLILESASPLGASPACSWLWQCDFRWAEPAPFCSEQQPCAICQCCGCRPRLGRSIPVSVPPALSNSSSGGTRWVVIKKQCCNSLDAGGDMRFRNSGLSLL